MRYFSSGSVTIRVMSGQGDQIRRIFAHWVIVNFGQFFENDRSRTNFRILFPDKSYVLILTKNGLGYILGDFHINSSGHPVSGAQQ
jgi:hypothetical protein